MPPNSWAFRPGPSAATRHDHYQFLFAGNAGHVDHATKLQTLPEALEYLLAGLSEALIP
jgi:hypothetical protein